MGARNVIYSSKAFDVDSAFQKVMNDVYYEYGHDRYNGYGGCADCGGRIMKFDGKVLDSNRKKAKKRINEYFKNDEGFKDRLNYIDLGVLEYQIITTKKVPAKKGKAPKFKRMYVVKSGVYFDNDGKVTVDDKLFSSEDKKIAEEKMLTFAADYPEVHCTIEYVLAEGCNEVSSVDVKTSKRASKPAKVPSGAIVKELHEYLFFGWVSE